MLGKINLADAGGINLKRVGHVRVIRRDELLSQVRNYNSALAEISPDSRYCKIVQADDAIFPECLAAMVEVFERSESIGLVSSYYLKGDRLMGSGMPFPATVVDGREMARFYLRTGIFVFGSPTTVCYRSSIVRGEAPFFDETYLHEDTDTRAIDNFIVRLRRYLNEDPAKPRHVLTVRGVGYKFIAEPNARKQ